MINYILIVFIFLLFPLTTHAFGQEPIPISISSSMEKIIFDGKWSNELEWKESSWETISSPAGTIHLRIAHQGDFIYILLDAVDDLTIDHISDTALICIDGKNDKTIIPNSNDYCFFTSLNSKQSFVYQGGSPLASNNYFKKIYHVNDFIGIGSKSDHNDKYSKIPHPSYEFKIPIELFGRSNIYGFYFHVYDASNSQYYSWPENLVPNNTFDIPSPNRWGELVSPDKSIPEFSLPILVLIPSIILVIYFTTFLQKHQKL